jgi:MFS family permease
VERVKNILIQPKSEWAVIEREDTDTRTLYTSYIAILALIPAVATLFILSGGRTGMGLVLGSIITQYGLGLAMVYAVAFIADILAPNFEGKRESAQALKLTAYAMTASWAASVFAIVPGIGWLLSFLGSLYSIYLFYLGAPILMKVPESKAVAYSVVVMVAAMVLGAVIGFIGASIMGFGATGTMMRPREF